VRTAPLIFFAVLFALAACTSPETGRSRGSGPGADVGNRTTAKMVRMHEGSDPFAKTPKIISSQGAPLAGARQADQLSRR
jgi:hypothetical protein